MTAPQPLSKLFMAFVRSEQTSGLILVLCTAVSIALANSPIGHEYLALWHASAGTDQWGIGLQLSVAHWINDGLMAIFFLLIGLEIERELYVGELSDPRNAALPIVAAVGGIVFPALIHFLLNRGTDTQGGMGIPMATDIAFALGVVALLGNKVPLGLRVFLAAVAIIDDLGAIVIIALFYTGKLSFGYLAGALGIFVCLVAMNRLGVRRLAYYLIPGVVMWYCMLQSGIHATVAGVLLAFAIPFGHGEDNSPSSRLQHALHKPVAFIIMPLFALANTGIVLTGGWLEGLASSNSVGIVAGLSLGKPLGIGLLTLSAVKLGLALPTGVSWRHIIGGGFLAGIGFTMSIFITLLAFSSPDIVQDSKIAILLASLLAGGAGSIILSRRPAKDGPIAA